MMAVAGVAVSLSAADDAVADLKAAVAALQSKNETTAIVTLKGLSGRLPQIPDYVAWFRATAFHRVMRNTKKLLIVRITIT